MNVSNVETSAANGVNAREAFRRLTHARSVCIVGASADESSIGGQAVDRLLRHGFSGRVALVNPKHSELYGLPCYPSVGDVPHPMDAALICVPAVHVPGVIRECGAAGVSVAVVVASGFEEVVDGDALVADLRDALTSAGVRIVGPNTEGVWSVPGRVFLTFGTASSRESFEGGPVSVISQSGGIGTAVVRQLQDRGIGFRYFVGIGNETDLTCMDALDAIVNEGDGVVVLYTEGFRDGHRLLSIMNHAREANVPVIAMRAGISEQGRIATQSHTGRTATAPAIYRDVFRQAGVLDVGSISELWMAAETLAVARRTCPGPYRRTSIVSVSGGCSGVLADAAATQRVPLTRLGEGTLQALASVLPSYASIGNPLDPTGSVLRDPTLLPHIVDLVAADSATDVVILQLGNSAVRQAGEHADALAAIVRRRSKPLILSSISDPLPQSLHRRLLTSGILWASDPREAVMRAHWLVAATERDS